MNRIRFAAALAALALIPGALEAQTTLTACYVPKSGTVYRIKVEGTPTKCSQNHVEFSWTTGAAGLSEPTIVQKSFIIPAGQTASESADCPQGSYPMSGGYVAQLPEGNEVVIHISVSMMSFGFASWHVGGRNEGTDPATVVVEVACIDFTP
jgi:hypothetical protein